jgi:hypothetical protein
VERLAESGLHTFWISIDSADPVVHEQMRGLPGVIDGIEIALQIFHAHGIYPSANLGINKYIGGLSQNHSTAPPEFFTFYRDAFQKYYNLVIHLGFTIVNVCDPMSIEENNRNGLRAVYGTTAAGGITRFTLAEKALVFEALYHTIPEFRHRVRIFSPRSSLFSFRQHHVGGETPRTFASKILHDEKFRKLWIEDLKYFKDCDFFDCSKAPDFGKLAFLYQQEGPSA